MTDRGTGPRPAGQLSAWLADFAAALAAGTASDVPCGGCTACCRSAQFVHIEADETDALAHIPAELLFPAPGRPAGHMVLGYDEQGRCPMLGDAGCRIYEHRPRTCRVYDCRVFAATEVTPDQPLIAEQAGRWRFSTPGDRDLAAAAALAGSLPPTGRPAQRAVEAARGAAALLPPA